VPRHHDDALPRSPHQSAGVRANSGEQTGRRSGRARGPFGGHQPQIGRFSSHTCVHCAILPKGAKCRPFDARPWPVVPDHSHPQTTMVRKGSSVRVRQRALIDLQGESNSLRGSGLGLAQRGRNFRTRSDHFVTPRPPIVGANRPGIRPVLQDSRTTDPFSRPPSVAAWSAAGPGGAAEPRSPGRGARLAGCRDRSSGVVAARRRRRAGHRPRGPP
jgi:hypothetical protein